jgi:hypothetical protein
MRGTAGSSGGGKIDLRSRALGEAVKEIPEQGVVLRDLLESCAGFHTAEFSNRFHFPFLIQQTRVSAKEKNFAIDTKEGGNHQAKRFNPLDRIVFGITKKNPSKIADAITIGREAGNDIVLPYHFISKDHAFFAYSAGNWQITDNNSTNGVFVGKQRLDGGEAKTLKNKIQMDISRYLRFQFIESAHMFNFLRLASTLYG